MPGHSKRDKRLHPIYGPTYQSWTNMRARCRNKNDSAHWPRYGGRGIQVCERWRDFELFLLDMGLRPEGATLDRIENDGDYSPENCRWATPSEQQMNKARHFLYVCHKGHVKTGWTTNRKSGARIPRCLICHREWARAHRKAE